MRRGRGGGWEYEGSGGEGGGIQGKLGGDMEGNGGGDWTKAGGRMGVRGQWGRGGGGGGGTPSQSAGGLLRGVPWPGGRCFFLVPPLRPARRCGALAAVCTRLTAADGQPLPVGRWPAAGPRRPALCRAPEAGGPCFSFGTAPGRVGRVGGRDRHSGEGSGGRASLCPEAWPQTWHWDNGME